MATWSRILLSGSQKLFQRNGLLTQAQPKNEIARCMSEHRTMNITPSRFAWYKTKDLLHLYFFVGAIPVAIVIFCANVFVGPATLESIPEGYVPKRWEYFRSPITRFFARYCFPNPQQEYEKYLHVVHRNHEIKLLREIEGQIAESQRQHQDHPSYYYRFPLKAGNIQQFRKEMEAEPS